MANNFNKQETVMFEDGVQGFLDNLVASKNVVKYATDGKTMERSGDIVWRPMPYISTSYDGTDATENFKAQTQLSVPATIGYEKHATALLNATELRDALVEGSLAKSKLQRLASDINTSVMTVAANQGTVFVKRSAAAAGFDDLAQADALFNESGVDMAERVAFLSSRDYNNMASNLAARSTMTGKPTTAYEKAFVGNVAGFDTYKLDVNNRLTAAAGGGSLTVDTRSTASNYYQPKATRTASTGERSNMDNRYQTITISSTTSVAAGDAFTIAGVNACHHITKGDSGQLKTFRVISVDSSTTMTISPPIISNQGATEAESQYQNVIVTASATAAIVFLNTVTAAVNPFWVRSAIEVLPGRYAVPTDAGAQVLRATTEQGFEVTMQKQYDINTMNTLYRWDVRYGVVMLQPEMAGIMMFSQT